MNLSVGQVALLVAFSFLLASGQILFKYTATLSPNLNTPEAFLALLASPRLWAALTLYATATLLWIYILQHIPISRAYPFAALGFIIVPLAGKVLFSETISQSYILGVVLIVVGIYLTGFVSD